MSRKLGIAGIVAVVASLLFAGIALALQIVVDGAIGDWTVGGDPDAAFIRHDNNEQGPPASSDIPNEFDVSDLFFTNNTTEVYFRWDTYADVAYGGTFQYVCIDIDPNATPATGGSISQCASQTGVDYIVRVVDGSISSTPLVDCGDTATRWAQCTSVSSAGMAFAYSGNHSELGVPLANIGFTLPLGTGNCPNSSSGQPCDMHIALYFDNGDTPPDDNVPDFGDVTVQVGCAAGGTPCSPTAVTLNSLQAQPTTSPVLPVALIGVTALALIGVAVFVRRRKTA